MKKILFLGVLVCLLAAPKIIAMSITGQSMIQSVMGQGTSRASVPWADAFVGSDHAGNTIDGRYAAWPRRTITYSPFASVAVAAVLGGAAVHYGLTSNNLSDRQKNICIAGLLLGLGAYVYKPVYWGVVQGCWNRLSGRAWNDPWYTQF